MTRDELIQSVVVGRQQAGSILHVGVDGCDVYVPVKESGLDAAALKHWLARRIATCGGPTGGDTGGAA